MLIPCEASSLVSSLVHSNWFPVELDHFFSGYLITYPTPKQNYRQRPSISGDFQWVHLGAKTIYDHVSGHLFSWSFRHCFCIKSMTLRVEKQKSPARKQWFFALPRVEERLSAPATTLWDGHTSERKSTFVLLRYIQMISSQWCSI